MGELDTLVDEIFVNSFKKVSTPFGQKQISPLNYEIERERLDKSIERDYEKRVPYSAVVSAVLRKLSTAIKSANGITRDIYDEYDFALNVIAGSLSGTHKKADDGLYNVTDDDLESIEVDGRFNKLKDGGNHQEISWKTEATLFHRGYDSDLLTSFRIFQQTQPHGSSKGYRFTNVATVDLGLLQERIHELADEKREKVDLPDLPYDQDDFAYEKIPEFNDKFGEYVTLNVFDINDEGKDTPKLVLEFKDPHSVVAQDFVNLGEDLGSSGTSQYSDVRSTGYGILFQLDDRSKSDENYDNLGKYKQHNRLDTTSDDISTYLDVSLTPAPAFPELLKGYIRSKIEQTRT
jgi:hypothetical protein